MKPWVLWPGAGWEKQFLTTADPTGLLLLLLLLLGWSSPSESAMSGARAPALGAVSVWIPWISPGLFNWDILLE